MVVRSLLLVLISLLLLTAIFLEPLMLIFPHVYSALKEGHMPVWEIEFTKLMNKHAANRSLSVHSTEHLSWAARLRANYHVIRDELDAYRQNHAEFPTAKNLPDFLNYGNIDSRGEWNILWLRLASIDSPRQRNFPKTMQVIRDSGVPAVGLKFSRMPAGAWLNPHIGTSNMVIRYHLVLKATGNSSNQYLSVWNCRMVPGSVGSVRAAATHMWKAPGVWSNRQQQRAYEAVCPERRLPWKEGGDVYFDDTFLHTAVNLHEEERIILWIDVSRTDLPWRVDLLNRLLIWIAPYLRPEFHLYV